MSDKRLEALYLLKTAKGQLAGIMKMIESGQHCKDTANEIMAVIPLLKHSQSLILKQHMEVSRNEYRKTKSTPLA